MKLYREVKASERFPEKDAKVYTDVGLAVYCGSDNWMADYPDGGFVFGINVVKWWLEPIEITEDRPVLKNFFSEDASLNDVHETYINAKPLFQYAQALEEYIDSLLSKLKGE